MATAILTGQGGKRYKTNQISGLTATVGWATANTVKLTWTNPTDVNFKGLVIRYKAGSYPAGPTDGYSFYDSNDATPVATYTLTGGNIVDGTTFYFRAFAYSYIGATRVYNSDTAGAQVNAIPYRNQGMQTFTASGTFTVPYGVNTIDVFLVGGGGGGCSAIGGYGGGGGGGGGYTKTYKTIPVTPGSLIPITVGAGGTAQTNATNFYSGTEKTANPGGSSSVVIGGTTYSAAGGLGGGTPASMAAERGGNGGSGGGGVSGSQSASGIGGSNGSNGGGVEASFRGIGQGTTTKAFEDSTGTLYSGGGGVGSASDYSTYAGGAGGSGGGGAGAGVTNGGPGTPIAGTNGTGGGGGGAGCNTNYSSSTIWIGATGGSGIVIIRWGY